MQQHASEIAAVFASGVSKRQFPIRLSIGRLK
jgi:hypothetical protein